jgi:hypothetical protein
MKCLSLCVLKVLLTSIMGLTRVVRCIPRILCSFWKLCSNTNTSLFKGMYYFLSVFRIQVLHLSCNMYFIGACSSVVGWGTTLQAGRSRVRFLVKSLDFSINLILPAALWPWGWLSLQQKWIPGIFLVGKGLPARGADNLTAICEPTV